MIDSFIFYLSSVLITIITNQNLAKKSKMLNKNRSHSQKRVIKLDKIGFQIQAQELRKDYENKQRLSQLKLKVKFQQRVPSQGNQTPIGDFLKPTRIIAVTAHKWAIFDYFSGKYLRGYRAKDQHDLSSFSKLLVFCAVNTLLERHQIDITRFQVITTGAALKMHHGENVLKQDDIISLQDLLHLLVMQQSQVYETLIALNVGAFLQKKRKKQYYSVFDANDSNSMQHLRLFYELVSSYCQLLHLQNIKYVQCDPFLRKQKNKCSAYDVGILSIQCLKIPLFSSVMRKQQHTFKIKFVDSQGHLSSREATVVSKRLLNKYIPYFSVCRNWDVGNFMNSNCSIFYQHHQQLRPIVAILLGAYGPKDRQKDIQQIVEWYIKNPNIFDISEESLKRSPVRRQILEKKPLKIIPEIQQKLKQKLRGSEELGLIKFGEAVKLKNRGSSFRLKTLN